MRVMYKREVDDGCCVVVTENEKASKRMKLGVNLSAKTEGKVQCVFCRKSMKRPNLARHMERAHSENGKFLCPVRYCCNEPMDLKVFKEHWKYKHENKKKKFMFFECKLCSSNSGSGGTSEYAGRRFFQTMSDLWRHEDEMHNGDRGDGKDMIDQDYLAMIGPISKSYDMLKKVRNRCRRHHQEEEEESKNCQLFFIPASFCCCCSSSSSSPPVTKASNLFLNTSASSGAEGEGEEEEEDFLSDRATDMGRVLVTF